MRPEEDLRCLLKLAHEGRALFEALALLSPISRLLFLLSAFQLVESGGYLSEYPTTDILLSDTLSLPDRAVVVVV